MKEMLLASISVDSILGCAVKFNTLYIYIAVSKCVCVLHAYTYGHMVVFVHLHAYVCMFIIVDYMQGIFCHLLFLL